MSLQTMPKNDTRCFEIFEFCAKAIADGKLIQKVSDKDKEYHFQNWFKDRLEQADVNADQGGRNSYPDFMLVETAEGYELKALAYPGRQVDFDSNSRIPTGLHNGRTIFYVFGRYPKAKKTPNEYPLVDLVICHGDFLNADSSYVHKNKHVRGFGSYGDIKIRDRKMYVAPTPFALLTGATGLPTLIVPSEYALPEGFREVGRLVRVESAQLVIGYEADLKANTLVPKYVANPNAGKPHEFVACRPVTASDKAVSLTPAKDLAALEAQEPDEDDEDEDDDS